MLDFKFLKIRNMCIKNIVSNNHFLKGVVINSFKINFCEAF